MGLNLWEIRFQGWLGQLKSSRIHFLSCDTRTWHEPIHYLRTGVADSHVSSRDIVEFPIVGWTCRPTTSPLVSLTRTCGAVPSSSRSFWDQEKRPKCQNPYPLCLILRLSLSPLHTCDPPLSTRTQSLQLPRRPTTKSLAPSRNLPLCSTSLVDGETIHSAGPHTWSSHKVGTVEPKKIYGYSMCWCVRFTRVRIPGSCLRSIHRNGELRWTMATISTFFSITHILCVNIILMIGIRKLNIVWLIGAQHILPYTE